MTFLTIFSEIYIFYCLATYDTGTIEYLVVYVNKHSMNRINAVQSIPTASEIFEIFFHSRLTIYSLIIKSRLP